MTKKLLRSALTEARHAKAGRNRGDSLKLADCIERAATGCGFFFFWRGKSSARGPGSKKCNVNEVIVIDFASRTSILLLNGRAKSWLSRPLVLVWTAPTASFVPE